MIGRTHHHSNSVSTGDFHKKPGFLKRQREITEKRKALQIETVNEEDVKLYKRCSSTDLISKLSYPSPTESNSPPRNEEVKKAHDLTVFTGNNYQQFREPQQKKERRKSHKTNQKKKTQSPDSLNQSPPAAKNISDAYEDPKNGSIIQTGEPSLTFAYEGSTNKYIKSTPHFSQEKLFQPYSEAPYETNQFSPTNAYNMTYQESPSMSNPSAFTHSGSVSAFSTQTEQQKSSHPPLSRVILMNQHLGKNGINFNLEQVVSPNSASTMKMNHQMEGDQYFSNPQYNQQQMPWNGIYHPQNVSNTFELHSPYMINHMNSGTHQQTTSYMMPNPHIYGRYPSSSTPYDHSHNSFCGDCRMLSYQNMMSFQESQQKSMEMMMKTYENIMTKLIDKLPNGNTNQGPQLQQQYPEHSQRDIHSNMDALLRRAADLERENAQLKSDTTKRASYY